MKHLELEKLLGCNGNVQSPNIDFINRNFSFTFQIHEADVVNYYCIHFLKFFRISYAHDRELYNMVGWTSGLWVNMEDVEIKQKTIIANEEESVVYEVNMDFSGIRLTILCEKIDYYFLYQDPRQNDQYILTH